MEDRRPYWKVAASLLVSLIGTVVFVVVGFQLMRYFMPFVIGWVIAMIANPVVRWLEKRLKIVRKLGSAIIIVMVLGLIVTGLYFGFSKAFTEIKIFIDNFPEMYQQFEEDFRQIGREFQGIFHLLPAELQVGWDEMVNNMDQGMQAPNPPGACRVDRGRPHCTPLLLQYLRVEVRSAICYIASAPCQYHRVVLSAELRLG